MRVIGKSKIDFVNQIKDVKFVKHKDNYEMLLIYYNNRKENFILNDLEIVCVD